MSTGPKTITETSKTSVADEYKPLLAQHVANTQGLFDNGIQTADMTELQRRALSQVGGLDQSGFGAATDLNNRMIQGEFLDGNPYLDKQLQKSLDTINTNYQANVNDIDSTAARSGIFGGSVWQKQQNDANKQLVSGLADASNQAYMTNYENERVNQINAMNNSAGLFGDQLSANAGLFDMGANEQMFNQAVMDEDIRKQQLLAEALGVGYQGSTQTQNKANPNYVSPFNRVAGLVGLGTSIYTAGKK